MKKGKKTSIQNQNESFDFESEEEKKEDDPENPYRKYYK